MTIQERFIAWKTLPTLSEADEKKLLSMSDEEIEDSFYQELAFGTAGLRGKIGPGTNRMNEQVIARATRGLAGVIEKRGKEAMDRGVAIAWDVRERSECFMEVAAAMLASCGIQVYIYSGIRPTPMLSFAVRELKTQAGIVVTASHNPKEYNGYKVYWQEGSQIRDDLADEISEEIDQYDYSVWPEKSFQTYEEEGFIHRIDEEVEKKYYALTLNKAVEKDIKKDLSIVYTPLNGTGNWPVRHVLHERGFSNVHLVEEQTEPDSTFKSVGYPNPEDLHAFEKALVLGKDVDADLLIATDPDCDRVAIIAKNAEGEFIPFSGNQTGALLLEYILSRRSAKGDLPANGAVVKSIVTGDIGRKICAHYDVEMFDALTGFKNICALANEWDDTGEHEFLFGFEESIGYVYGDHVRDKDAVVTSMMVAEMAAYYLSRGKRLPEVLEEIYEEYGYQGERLFSVVKEGQEGQALIRAIMKDIRENPIGSVKDLGVEKIVDYAEGVEGIGTSNVLEYHLDDGSCFYVRPSGTEPKIKLYIYTNDKNKEYAKEKIDWIESAVTDRFNRL
ncbi:MAG: phospho-sugar mutase [Peptoniphilus sp.]|nr:phospho-sugar mutase [Peptoniphilus sp.]MDY3117989.1 phospho-sugar mutase [Peptoniphilus sp.]